MLRLSWPVHDDGNADQTHGGTDHVEPIRPIAVENPAPQKRQHNEKSSVGCIDATEVSGLQRRDHTIKTEHQPSQQTPGPRAIFSNPLPDQPPSADLTQTSQDE